MRFGFLVFQCLNVGSKTVEPVFTMLGFCCWWACDMMGEVPDPNVETELDMADSGTGCKGRVISAGGGGRLGGGAFSATAG